METVLNVFSIPLSMIVRVLERLKFMINIHKLVQYYVVQKFPFRIKMIRTDNGHEFQTKFHWHVGELGMIHVYIKPATPRLNGKVERSHLTDQHEFYQMLDYKGDFNLRKKLAQWEDYYNFLRPHSAHMGKTPYEKLKQRMLG